MNSGLKIVIALFILAILSLSFSLVSSEPTDISKTTRGNTINVIQNGTGDYTTIQEALNNAEAEDTIYVHSGTYNETLFINTQVELIGSGDQPPVILSTGYENLITINADRCLLSNLVLSGENVEPRTNIELDDEKASSGIIIKGNLNTIQGCNVSEFDVGITFYFSTDNTVQNSYCTFNHLVGITDMEGKRNSVRKNTLSNNKFGIRGRIAKETLIEQNICINNRGDGISLDDCSFLKVQNNLCKDNGENGIFLWSCSQNEITYNECNNNSISGIHLELAHDNKIMQNDCRNNDQYGIYVATYSEGNKVQNNDCTSNDKAGIYVDFLASGNDIDNNKGGLDDDSQITTGLLVVCVALIVISMVLLLIGLIRFIKRKQSGPDN